MFSILSLTSVILITNVPWSFFLIRSVKLGLLNLGAFTLNSGKFFSKMSLTSSSL